MNKSPMIDPENIPNGLTPKQHIWDDFGRWAQHKISECPEAHVIRSFPYGNEPWGLFLSESIGPLGGRSVLDLGCGLGYFCVYTAREGAKVIGIDLQLGMLQASKLIATINAVKCHYHQANMSKLPFYNDSFDRIVGLKILHHLSKPDLITAMNEVHRVLSPRGKAIFVEPVENNRVFNFVQNLFPAGRRYSGYYRPSCLSRRAWAIYRESHDGRDITSQELVDAGGPFESVSVEPFGLFNRLDRFIKNKRLMHSLHRIDHHIFKLLPFLKRFSREVVVEYQK